MELSTLQSYALIDSEISNEENSEWSGHLRINKTNARALSVLLKNELCEEVCELVSDDNTKNTTITLSDKSSVEFYEGKTLRLALERNCNKLKHPVQKDWGEFLSIQNVLLEPVNGVYFTSDKILSDASSNDSKFQSYLSISKVCSLLTGISDTSISEEEYVFIFGHALRIKFSINEACLTNTVDTLILQEMLNNEIHKEAKKSLVKEALVRFLKNINEADRFQHLIKNFNGFSSEILISYEQFLKDYTFDKVRKEYQEKKTDYVARLNKVFDDIATKTLAIPAGLWFAMNQIKEAESAIQSIKNTSTLLIVTLLTFIVIFNILGQFSTLKVLKSEYKKMFATLEESYMKKVSYEETYLEEISENEKDLSEIKKSKDELDEVEKKVFIKLSLTVVLIVLISTTIGALTYISNSNF